MNPVVFCILLAQVGSIFGSFPYNSYTTGDVTGSVGCVPSFSKYTTNGVFQGNPCITPALGTKSKINSNLYDWCMVGNGTIYSGFWRYCNNMRESTWTCDPSSSYQQYQGGLCQYCETTDGNYLFDISQITQNCPVQPPVSNANCDPKYSAMSPWHTACKNPSPNYDCVEGLQVMDQTMKDTILALHNFYRIMMKPGEPAAARMQKLTWNDELAMLAGKHAQQCSFSHDDPNMRVIPEYYFAPGQNVAQSTSCKPHNWEEMFGLMFAAERTYFCHGPGLCPGQPPSKETYHYSQLMLDRVTQVGCAKSSCGFPDRYEQFWVCNYDIMQVGDDGKKPWTPAGPAGSGDKCAHKILGQDYVNQWGALVPNIWADFVANGGVFGNLCDSMGVHCKNGGTLISETNTCDCSNLPNGFFTGAQCEIPVEQAPISVSGGTCYFPFSWNGQSFNTCACDDEGCWCPSVRNPMLEAENGGTEFYVECERHEGMTMVA